MRLPQILLLSTSCLLASVFADADPTPFRAVYKADYKGLPVSAVGVRELKQVSAHTYILTSSARSLLVSITESSTFKISLGEVQPLAYQYSRTGVGRNRAIALNFDWITGKAINPKNQTEVDIAPGTLDKLLYQYKMREDLQSAFTERSPWPEMHYQVADDDQVKQYTFRVIGEEEIDTPVGRINTVKAIRVRDRGDRTTTFWMAPDYEFLLVRLMQLEKNGRGFELILKEAEFDGQKITGS